MYNFFKTYRGILLYAISWLVMAAFSVSDYSRIFLGSCYFNTSWLRCDSALSLASKVFIFFLITAVSFVFIFVGRSFWHNWAEKKDIYSKKIVVCLLALAFLVVPFGSSDIYYYFYAGEAANSGLNPYIAHWEMEKPFVYGAGREVVTSFSYGPIMLKYFSALYAISGSNIAVFIVLWKISMLAAILALFGLMRKLMKHIDPSGSVPAFTFFWLTQPLILFEVLVNGHFDVVWMIFVLWSFFAALKKQWWLVVPLLAIGVWIKFIPLLFSPFFALWWWQEITKENWKKYVSQIFVGCVLSGVATILSWGSLWEGTRVFASVVVQSKWAVISWFAVVYYSLKPLFVSLFQSNAHFILTRIVHAAIALAFGYVVWPYVKKIWRVVWKKEVWQPSEYLQAMFICMLAYLFIWQKSLWPWYTVWLIPIGILLYGATKNIYVKKIVMWISTTPFMFYSIWLANWWFRGVDAGNELWFYYIMVLGVTGYPLFLVWQWRKHDYALLDSYAK